MAYSPSQQAQIDAANKQLANAKAALDNAASDAQTKASDLNRCNCGKGKGTVVYGGHGNCVPYKTTISFPNLANSADCVDPPPINDCKTDCCSKSTCKSRVDSYNAAVSTYNTASINYNTAKDNLKHVLDSVAQQAVNDPDFIHATQELNLEADIAKKAQLQKWIVFAVFAVLILVAAMYFYKKAV